MKRLSYALAALSLGVAAPMPLLAQNTGSLPIVSPENTVLTITAEGRSSHTPDLAVFTAGVSSTGQTAAEALSANSEAMNRVVRALRNADIADRDIQTSNLSLHPVYAPDRPEPTRTLEDQTPRILGYRANNSVTVKLRRLNEYGGVIDTLVSAGANNVNGPHFQIEEPDAALDEARREAMTKARERATLYANAAGLRIVRILAITEAGNFGPRPQVMQAARAAFDQAESTPVSPGEVEVDANLTVMFELAP